MTEACTIKAVTVVAAGMWACTFLAMISAPTRLAQALAFQTVFGQYALTISRTIFIADRNFTEFTFPKRLASHSIDVAQTLLVRFVTLTMLATELQFFAYVRNRFNGAGFTRHTIPSLVAHACAVHTFTISAAVRITACLLVACLAHPAMFTVATAGIWVASTMAVAVSGAEWLLTIALHPTISTVAF